jgi:RimJ/RimL family protein N-acetyltransferase
LTPEDAPRIFEYCQDPEVQRWTSVPSPYTLADAEEHIAKATTTGWSEPLEGERTWGIRVLSDDGQWLLAGSVGLRPDGHGALEVGYLLAADCRGGGLGTRAVRAAVEHALKPKPEGMGARRVLWTAFVGNWASRRLATRCGFTIEGTVRSHVVSKAGPVDCWIGTILAADLDRQTMMPLGAKLAVPAG